MKEIIITESLFESSEEEPFINYKFYYGDKCYTILNNSKCEKCASVFNSTPVDDNYVVIIRGLKKAGLLPVDYPLTCCRCWKN